MTDDPIVSEVRRNRATILDSHGGDVRRYHAALEQDQARRFGADLVVLKPRPIIKPSTPSDRQPTLNATVALGAEGR